MGSRRHLGRDVGGSDSYDSGYAPASVGEADQAGQRLGNVPSAANAHYQRGEIYRLRGEWESAEAAHRQASELGRMPQPGQALLWRVQGQLEAAAPACVDSSRYLGRAAHPPGGGGAAPAGDRRTNKAVAAELVLGVSYR